MRAIEQDRALVRGRVFRRLVAVIQRDSVGRQTRAQRKMVLREFVQSLASCNWRSTISRRMMAAVVSIACAKSSFTTM